MKKTLVLLALVFSIHAISAQQINWVSLEEAVELQKANPKKIIIDMYTHWCGPCKMLDKRTFQNADVANYVNENYYAVKFNAQGNAKVTFKGKVFTNPNYDPAKEFKRNSNHELTKHFRIQAFPTIVFLDESLDVLVPLRGFQNPQQLELYLKMFGNDEHKDIKSQAQFNAYYKAFKAEFQG